MRKILACNRNMKRYHYFHLKLSQGRRSGVAQARSVQTNDRPQEISDMRPHAVGLLAAPTHMATTVPLQAFDINQQLSVDGSILGAGQCQSVSALLPGGGYGGSAR